MSGSLLSPWLRSHPRSNSHPALMTSRAIARSLGCYGENYVGQKSKSVLACLRQKGSEEILKAFQSAYKVSLKNFNFTFSFFLLHFNPYLLLFSSKTGAFKNYHKL